MYYFRDVTDTTALNIIPAEALQINGEYIENQIDGYRTLSVQGRELSPAEVSTIVTGTREGARIKNRRQTERVLKVKYQLTAQSSEAFRAAYTALNKILNVQDAELVFADEPDKFFIGTPSSAETVDAGNNAVTGSFDLLLADPYKYSLKEYEVDAVIAKEELVAERHSGEGYSVYDDPDVEGPQNAVDFTIVLAQEPLAGFNITRKGVATVVAELAGFGLPPVWKLFIPREFRVGTPKTISHYYQGSAGETYLTEYYDGNRSFKYSVTRDKADLLGLAVTNFDFTYYVGDEYWQTAQGNPLIVVNYGGTAPARPRFQIDFYKDAVEDNTDGDCGYVAIVDDKRHILQLGKPEEADEESFERTQTLTNTKFQTIPTSWAKNTGLVTSSSFSSSGTAGIQSYKYTRLKKGKQQTVTRKFVGASSYGSGAKWHGPQITRTLPADGAGNVGAVDFDFSWAQAFAISKTASGQKQYGACQILLTGADGKIVAGVMLIKSSDGSKGRLKLYADHEVKRTVDNINFAYRNKRFGVAEVITPGKAAKNSKYKIKPVEACSIRKRGGDVLINLGGLSYRISDPDLKNKDVRKISFAFYRYGTKPPLTLNGVYWSKFVKRNCDTLVDKRNCFSTNDILTADCSDASIHLGQGEDAEGESRPDLGALGNDWEQMVLAPGQNRFSASYSDWVTDDHAPQFKVIYREAFL